MPAMTLKIFASCTNEKIYAHHLCFTYYVLLAFCFVLPRGEFNIGKCIPAPQSRPFHLLHHPQTQRDRKRPPENLQRSRAYGSHTRNRPLPRWDCCYAGELQSEHEVGRGGWTGVRDRGEFYGGVSGPQGNDEIH